MVSYGCAACCIALTMIEGMHVTQKKTAAASEHSSGFSKR
ncbi:MAG: hypothetical protein JWR68_1644 [Polaromonas sp.]|nr:hypothetical protein [Polaromonas sp.]